MAIYNIGIYNLPRISVCVIRLFTQFFGCRAIILVPDMLESQSKAVKTRMIA